MATEQGEAGNVDGSNDPDQGKDHRDPDKDIGKREGMTPAEGSPP